ncbi:MAG TPA: SagB/ThcOx family dehydrogenase [Chitinivibrionales bacterium]|jgi:nitroreductase|nr:SagB/ThcOx family dehydrogenase [Chitinivibrionales bacterium]
MKHKRSTTIDMGFLPITLPKPSDWHGKSVYASLKARRTTREISSKPFSLQMLSNLLWAADGVNRKAGPFGLPGRTAASASNSREIDVYIALENGVYLYEPAGHRLVPIAKGDFRSIAIGYGQKTWGSSAAVRLIYVADIDKFKTSGFDEPRLHEPEGQKAYYYADTGLIAGNVYLFAASQGLAAWFHNCDREMVVEKLHLQESKRVLFGQTIGYARKP